MKKPALKAPHNQPKLFFLYCQTVQNQPKSKFLFHKNCSPRDLCIMTLTAALSAGGSSSSSLSSDMVVGFSTKVC